MKKSIEGIFEGLENKIIEYRRDFHKYPEEGWTEFRTASIIGKILDELGYKVKMGKEIISGKDRMGLPEPETLKEEYERAIKQGADINYISNFEGGYTAIEGVLDCGPGSTIALRFDIDALRVKECKEERHLPYREGFNSVNKNLMHACGHDAHISIGLGVAEAIMNLKDRINGKVKLIFQPAEEEVRGAKAIVKGGCLDDVDYIIGSHIGLKAKKSGEVYCGVGGFLSTSKLNVRFKGKSAHAGNSPEKGNNAMLAAATTIMNLNSIPRNSKGASRVNVGKIISGTGRNVVPETAYMELETRGETLEINKYMKEYAERIIMSSANMHNNTVKIEYVGEAVDGDSDQSIIDIIAHSANSCEEFNNIYRDKVDFGASEDFTYMMKHVQSRGGKGAYFILGSDLKSEHHNSEFDFNEKDLIKGVKLYTHIILSLLGKENKAH